GRAVRRRATVGRARPALAPPRRGRGRGADGRRARLGRRAARRPHDRGPQAAGARTDGRRHLSALQPAPASACGNGGHGNSTAGYSSLTRTLPITEPRRQDAVSPARAANPRAAEPTRLTPSAAPAAGPLMTGGGRGRRTGDGPAGPAVVDQALRD